jgi:hypothetical protein
VHFSDLPTQIGRYDADYCELTESMNTSPILDIELRHIKALIDLLDEQAGAFLSDATGGNDQWRVYFADADVLSTFVDPTTHDPLHSWESLLSLTDGTNKKAHQASSAAASLANVTGQAVTRYLFGAFRKTAEIQRCRIYVTPEHEREFKAIVHALLNRQAKVEASWLDRLRKGYLDLARHDSSSDTGLSAARHIVELLESHGAGGAEDRAFTLLRDAIVPLSSHLLMPPLNEVRPFLFATIEPAFHDMLVDSRRNVWEAFSSSLRKRVRSSEELLPLKRVVFDAESGVDDQAKPFFILRSQAMKWLESKGAPPSLQDRRDLESQIKIAAREAADLGALARINALGHWLNQHKSPPGGKRWETVLVSGSSMLPSLLKHWPEQAEPAAVKLMHPLALLRRVDLWDPAGTSRLRDADYLDQPHEFALSLLFRSSSSGKENSAPDNVDAFITSLRAQLDLVVAREAEVGDRGLARLRRMLAADVEFDRKAYQEAVRNLVTQRFVQTYRHLTNLFPGGNGELPANSLPTLDLPHSESAMRFMAKVRDEMRQQRQQHFLSLSADEHEASIRQDTTGYSALLASAIGYMARGRNWLPAAQTMSATAVLFAKGRGETCYPEGNEALYLEAFLKRMALTLSDDLEKFREAHADMIVEACRTLHCWADQEPEMASELVGKAPTAPTRLAWIDYRYRIEANAKDVFIALCKVLRQQQPELEWGPQAELKWEHLSDIAQASLTLHREGVRLIGVKDAWDRLMQPSIWFCRIQAGMSLLQVWLCWRAVSPADNASTVALQDFERALEPIVAGWWEQKDELGKLLPLLAAIFARDTDYARKWRQFKIIERQFKVSFAGIDTERFAWLHRLYQGNPSKPNETSPRTDTASPA